MTTKLVHMTCAVCNEYAGQFQQHWNRDAGYGVCSRCVTELAIDVGVDADTIKELYGTHGVNFSFAEKSTS
jgi:hypothetical protein